MKIKPNRISTFITTELNTVSAILIYGPNEGLIREYSRNARENVNKNYNDPFVSANITGDQLKEYPGLLVDEVKALSFSMERRILRVFNISDSVCLAFENLFKNKIKPEDALVVCEGSDFGPRSKLRKLFENLEVAAAIHCNDYGPREIHKKAQLIFKNFNIEVEKEALAWLVDRSGNDSAQISSEIDKIILYVGSKGNINLKEMMLLIGDSSEIELEEVCFAVAGGNLSLVDKALYKLFSDGVAPVRVLRAVSRHFFRLQTAVTAKYSGLDVTSAINTLRPPIYFKDKEKFMKQVQNWTPEKLEDVLILLAEAERGCKTSLIPAKPLCSRVLLNAATEGKRLSVKIS